ncbi:hypothetical protein [Alkalihalobacillus pseudalcaliphilus]|uniref:hypothetical protein n=1 Tax=Alkalihalobacillus pseudalcaliphilus TaxID=79884 RepID=UPI00064D799E|nr:hypothetical protein [Alkalihalobacillus pseudalcaliphilus]KMK75506.1 hypothetical protein AB990_09400 [Alkalihalobacillus pseudalcaliphilus]
MNNRNDEQKVIDMVKQISVEPSKQFKNETFKLVQEEIKYAREQAKKKKSWFRIGSPVFTASLAMIATIGLVSILWVSNAPMDPIGGPLGDKPDETEQKWEQPKKNEQIDEPDLYGLSGREEIIVEEVEIEGKFDTIDYQLLDRETIPFSTYYRGNMWEIVEREEEQYQLIELQATIDPETNMRIFLLNTKEREEAKDFFEEVILADYQQFESLMEEDSIVSVKVHDAEYEATYASLRFEHDYYYVIWQSAAPEFGDGWAAHYEVLMNEWQWK